MSALFTPDDITALAAEIDRQLLDLDTAAAPGARRGVDATDALPDKQGQAIEKVTGEKATRFLHRFKQAARGDLCAPGGVLYEQWQKWGDLSNENVLQRVGAILVAMGFSGTGLPLLAVALAVIVLHLGVKVICEAV